MTLHTISHHHSTWKHSTLGALLLGALFMAHTAEAASFNKTLKKGSQGSEVLMLQQVLQDFGYFPKDVTPTGYYGAVTVKAVQKFQKQKGLDQVGSVGPITRTALNFLTRALPLQ